MSLELLACNTQAAVREARVLPEPSQLICQAALWNLHHVHSILAGDIYRVLYHTNLGGMKKKNKPKSHKSTLENQSPYMNFLSCVHKLMTLPCELTSFIIWLSKKQNFKCSAFIDITPDLLFSFYQHSETLPNQ